MWNVKDIIGTNHETTIIVRGDFCRNEYFGGLSRICLNLILYRKTRVSNAIINFVSVLVTLWLIVTSLLSLVGLSPSGSFVNQALCRWSNWQCSVLVLLIIWFGFDNCWYKNCDKWTFGNFVLMFNLFRVLCNESWNTEIIFGLSSSGCLKQGFKNGIQIINHKIPTETGVNRRFKIFIF